MRFSEIKTKEDLAQVLGVPTRILTYYVYGKKTENLYVSFEIDKKGGGTRKIHAPVDGLKDVQRRLANSIWEDYIETYGEEKISKSVAHGFIKGKSIISNAAVHRHKKIVINADLEHFFDSFHYGRVKGFFEKNRNYLFPPELAGLIANLVCYNGCLPQGAPTSPIITNLICQSMDYKLLNLAKSYRMSFSRYADDLTFSTNDKRFAEKFDEFREKLNDEIKASGFTINWDKFRVHLKDSRQSVTGLVVNEKVNVPRAFYKITKSMAHKLYQTGSFDVNGKVGSLSQLEGRFAFIDSVVHYNNSLDGSKHKLDDLSASELQYRHFLFYKYFYGNKVPTIVTEGPTDILYLKAALKNRYKDFPDMVTYKTEIDGDKEKESFIFNIQFLNRTNKLMHFFGLNVNGADGMGSLNEAFYPVKEIGNSNNREKKLNRIKKRNSFSYIKQYRNAMPEHPSILLFDNEFVNKSKPLYKYVSSNEFKQPEKDRLGTDIKSNCFSRVYNGGILYIATMPLVRDLKETEMEDLFDPQWLAQLRIGGKSFNRSEKPSDKTFGKLELAKYVASHYEEIDFSGFDGLLNVIRDTIMDYEISLFLEDNTEPDNS